MKLNEESAENMEVKTAEPTDKAYVDDEQKGIEDTDNQLPSPEEKDEEQEHPIESPSNDVGFKKVFKFVGFKFTVRKDKTEKSEPVQLLNVKADDAEEATDGSGDHKEKLETVEEATQSESPHLVENTEEAQTEQMKEESSEKITEIPTEEITESKEVEIKNDGSKSPESPTSPSTNETASPLRKFFTQGWAGFRKRTSFRKPKEEEQQAIDKEKQEQEKEMPKKYEVKEEFENEKPVSEKDRAEVSAEASEEKLKSESEEGKEAKMVDVSTDMFQQEAVTSFEQSLPQESAENVNKESEIYLKDKSHLASKEKSEPVQECLLFLDQSTPTSCEEKPELLAPLATEVFDEKIDNTEIGFPQHSKKPEEHFEIVEDESEPKAPLATEIFDENTSEVNNDISSVQKKESIKTSEKEELILEQLVVIDAEIQREQPMDEQLKVQETVPDEQIKQTEVGSRDAAISKPPEAIINEVELLSSQERTKMQGSPLKKLFTKKLSGKKHKGKREEAKLEEPSEQIQMSDSAESPEEPKAESSASSPEEATEFSVAKVTDVAEVTEIEEASTDTEKKREGITPWASFKKMVTPKKRVRRLSESDKEDELDKVKSATLSSTESAPCEDQDDNKENGEEHKLEKSTDEPKRKVDTSVSWEALICVGSSKKRARKSSSSDEEVGQRLAQEGQKIEEGRTNKEAAPDMTFASSQESDQGQVSSSPEQVGSPSEGEGVSTWESFKRLVTPRRKSKTKMEERNEESATVSNLEHSALDGDSGKEESWVSFKKLMSGRKKKRSDGIPEHASVEETGEEITETNEDDSDVPAVVPLSEYEAAEQEKFEAQKAKQEDIVKEALDPNIENSEDTLIIKQSSEGLVHAVTVTVVEGERAVTSIEERSPSWISAALIESIEHANEDTEEETEKMSGTGIVGETVVVTKLMPEIRKDVSGDTIISELELTSEAFTAREEASGVEEVAETSGAEETTEMVSAVSRLTESPDTTEVATPVQEVEECQQNLDELNKQTQEVLQEVAEKVKLTDEAQVIGGKLSEVRSQSLSVDKIGQQTTVIIHEFAEKSFKEKEPEKTGEGTGSGQSQHKVKESEKEMRGNRNDVYTEMKDISKVTSLYTADESYPKIEQELVERQEIIEERILEEKSEDEDFVIVTVTTEVESKVTVVDKSRKQQEVSSEAIEKKVYDTTVMADEVKMSIDKTTRSEVTEDGVSEVAKSLEVTIEEKSLLSPKPAQVTMISDLKSENTKTTAVETKEAAMQNEIKDVELSVGQTGTQSNIIEVPLQNVVTEVLSLNEALNLENSKEVTVEACVKDADVHLQNVETETHVQMTESKSQLQKVEPQISVVNVKPEMHLLNTRTHIHGETVETEIPIRKEELEVHEQNAETVHTQKVETKDNVDMERESFLLQSVGADDLSEKAEVELQRRKAKAESSTQKSEMEFSTGETETEVLAEKENEEVYTEKTDVEAHREKLEAEVVKQKMEVEASKEKAEATPPVEQVEMKAHVQKADAQVTKEKIEMEVPAKMLDVQDHRGKTKTEYFTEQSNTDTLTEKAELEASAEMISVEAPSDMQFPAELAEEQVEAEVGSKQAEPKETLQNMETETKFPSGMTVTMNFLEQCIEAISLDALVGIDSEQSTVATDRTEVSMQKELQSEEPLTSETEGSSTFLDPIVMEQAITEVPVETGLLKDSTCNQEDRSQNCMAGMRCLSESHHTEIIVFEAPQSDELEDVAFIIESKCSEEIVTEAPPGQKEICPVESVMEVAKCTDTIASESPMEIETKDVISTFESAAVTEDTMKNEVGNIELAIESKCTEIALTKSAAKTELAGDTFISESGCTETAVPSAVLENKGEIALSNLRAASGKTGISGIPVRVELSPDILTLETIRPLPESLADSDSCGSRQTKMVLIAETEKATENIKLASGEGLDAAQVQQEVFPEQQKMVITDIPEVQSYDTESCVPVTAPAMEEQIIAETAAKETAFKTAPQVSFAHPGLALASGPDTEAVSPSEEATAVVEELRVPAVKCTRDDLIQEGVFDATPKMKLNKLDFSQEAKRTMVSSEKSPSSTLIEFQDDVPTVTVESQSTKIILNVIQNAVDKLEKTDELASVSKQLSESGLMGVNQCEVSEDTWTDQQLLVKDKIQNNKDHHESPIIVTHVAKKHEAFKTAEEMPLTFAIPEDGERLDFRKTDASLEAVKLMLEPDEQVCSVTALVQQDHGAVNELVKEFKKETSLQNENGEPKFDSEVDTDVPTLSQRAVVQGIILGDQPKESLDMDQPKLKNTEADLIVELQEPCIDQQTHVKSKDDQVQPSESVETHTEKDIINQHYASCGSTQLKSELTES